MCKKDICLLIIFSFLCSKVVSQELKFTDSLSIIKSENIVKSHFTESIKNNNYLLFSIADKWYLIIIDKSNYYEQHFINTDSIVGNIKDSISLIKKPDILLQSAFEKSIYKKEYINFSSDFFKNGYDLAEGNSTYFYLKEKNCVKYGESRLSVFVKPNPIDEKIYDYLRNALLNYISK